MRSIAAALLLLAPAYAGDVFQIFADHCYGCHSSDVQMGGLNLQTAEGIRKGGEHGKTVVPGNSAESRLYLMVSGKVNPQMPMAGPKLSSDDIAAIKSWIDDGAKMPEKNAESKSGSAKLPPLAPKLPVRPAAYDLAWSPDGKLLAIAGFKEVRLIDPATNKQLAALKPAPDAVRAVAFSRDGALLAAAGGLPARSGEVDVWDVAARKIVHTLKGHSDCIYAAVFSPDGKQMATASYDKLIKIWDVATEKEIRTLKDHIDAIYAVAITPDGKRLVSGAADRTVKIWDIASGERLYTLSDAQDGINTVALDPTGKYVAGGGLDKTIRIWSLGDKSGALVNSLIAHEDAILKLAWSADGKLLASSSADRTVKIFTIPELNEVASYPQSDWAYGLQFSPGGRDLAIGRWDGSLAVVRPHDAGRQMATGAAPAR